ncbi:amidohydrolase family protein [Pelagicoccus albus]|uniref:Amidohydrolase family protein n=2 Tax=Pelagicoccus albus TaxID=415222 RepID=A0A7X1B8X5_9BACT|nr:amidohydrolase family protein [Pelagicoccus albus]
MVFRDAVALLGTELQPFLCEKIVVEKGVFSEIQPVRPVSEVAGCGLVLVPGLCNAHTHVGDSPLQDGTDGLTLEEGFFRPHGYKYRELGKMSEAVQLPHLVEQLSFMVRTGTTMHIDFREQGVEGAKLLKKASAAAGIKSLILSQFQDSPLTEEQLLEDQAALREEVQSEFERMLDVADGFSESTMNDLTSVAWKWIQWATKRKGKLRAIHCLENEGYRNRSLEIAGKGDLQRAIELYDPHLIVHLTVANDEEIELLASSGKVAVLNPRANANLGLPLPPVAKLMKAGVPLLLGTDNVMLNAPNMLAELDFTYKLAKSQFGDARGPSSTSILKMATTNLSHVLPGIGEVGIGEGKTADFFVVDFRNPRIAYTRNLVASLVTRLYPEDVVLTVREGKVLYRNAAFESYS